MSPTTASSESNAPVGSTMSHTRIATPAAMATAIHTVSARCARTRSPRRTRVEEDSGAIGAGTVPGQMAAPGTGDERVIGRLLREVDRRAPYAVLDVLRSEVGRTVPSATVDILVADYSGTSFERMAGSDVDTVSEIIDIDGTPAGTAYASQDVVTVQDGPTLLVYQPLAAQGERLGVMEVRLPGPPGEGILGYLTEVA